MSHQPNSERLIGIVLISCVVISLLIANSPFSEYFFRLMHFKIPIGIGKDSLIKTFEHWINDGLMSVFFLLAGLEIKRELLSGQLSTLKKAILPVVAAAGGMFMPACIFALFNMGKTTIHGWAIPMATDIAFAIGILALVGKHAPVSLKIFLVALAIVDDIGAILVIALFYSHSLSINFLLQAMVVIGFLVMLNRLNVSNPALYFLPGIVLWLFIYKSGIHATISGVMLAFTIPYETIYGKKPIARIEHMLMKPVYFIILPLFVLVNTAIVLKPEAMVQIVSPMGIGIILGLLIGKPIGILIFSLTSIKFGWAQMPQGLTVKQLTGAGFLAGIGFTMSIFIALLSFSDSLQHDIAKMSILLASVLAALTGYYILRFSNKPHSGLV